MNNLFIFMELKNEYLLNGIFFHTDSYKIFNNSKCKPNFYIII